MKIVRLIARFFNRYSPEDGRLADSVTQITGHRPLNLALYKLAMVHSSVARENRDGYRESNERLEYLGDAILGAVVAEYLFKRFPYKDEGFLTEIRSRIVSRESLNMLARKIGLDDLVTYDARRKSVLSFKYLYGDAMEAFVGAVFLDRGFAFCRNFIIKKLLDNHFDLEVLIETDVNFKSKLIEWSQKNNKFVRFEIVAEKSISQQRQFKVQVMIDNELIAQGQGFSKKKAEQDAARKACEVLEI